MAKCNNCLRGARVSITGIDNKTLKMDMGGAVFYLIPTGNGKFEATLNSENLIEGDYACATWTGNEWIVTCRNEKNNCTN